MCEMHLFWDVVYGKGIPNPNGHPRAHFAIVIYFRMRQDDWSTDNPMSLITTRPLARDATCALVRASDSFRIPIPEIQIFRIPRIPAYPIQQVFKRSVDYFFNQVNWSVIPRGKGFADSSRKRHIFPFP